ncbi:MAG: hypothetical protein IT531_14145 [Burkholderiales bacterium]|nr:hypothetical protein [Burkholderiales bacterium]
MLSTVTLAVACIAAHANVILLDVRIDGYDMISYGGPAGQLSVLLRVDADHDQDVTPDFGIYGATFDLGFGGSTYSGTQGWLKVGNTGRGFPNDLVTSLIIGSKQFPGVNTTSEFPYLEVHLVGDSDALWPTDAVPTDASFAPHITGARVFRQVFEPSNGITRVVETTHEASAIGVSLPATVPELLRLLWPGLAHCARFFSAVSACAVEQIRRASKLCDARSVVHTHPKPQAPVRGRFQRLSDDPVAGSVGQVRGCSALPRLPALSAMLTQPS